MNRTRILLFIGILLIAILVTKILFVDPKISDKSTPISLQLKWLNQAQFAGFDYAKEAGYYKEQGLEVNINPGGPDISSLQMVLSGTSQFGIIGADQIILARAKGAPVVAVAVIYKKSPVALASKVTSNIQVPKDLESQTVAIVYGKDEEIMYRALLSKSGVDRSKINEVPLSFDLNQLILGKVDSLIVYEMNEPVLLSQQNVEVNLLKPRDYGVNMYADTLFTTESMTKEHPDVVKKFVQASIRGWQDTYKNPEQAINYVMNINPSLNKEHQSKFLELSRPLIASPLADIGKSEISDWQVMQDLLLEFHLLEKPINLNQAYTNEYIQ